MSAGGRSNSITAANVLSQAASGASRKEQLKRISYNNKLWREAQATQSSLIPNVMQADIDGSFEIFDRFKKREVVLKQGGVQATPYKKGRADQIVVSSRSYHDADIQDMDDAVEGPVDYFAATMTEMSSAMARKADTAILCAFTLQNRLLKADKQDSTSLITEPNPEPEPFDRDVMFIPDATGTASTLSEVTTNAAATRQTILNSDSLESLRLLFRKRDVMGQICITLTADLAIILRRDSDFKNAENVYKSQTAAGASIGQGFEYKGFKFVDVSDQVLPTVFSGGKGAVDSIEDNGETLRVACREIKIGKPRAYYQSQDLEVAASITTNVLTTRVAQHNKAYKKREDLADSAADIVEAADYKLIEVTPSDLAYVWVKKAVLFVQRPKLSMVEESKNVNLSYAKQIYMRRNFGALVKDDDYVCVMPVMGVLRDNDLSASAVGNAGEYTITN